MASLICWSTTDASPRSGWMDLSAQNADTVVDVTGLIVGPGFIDLHSHVHSIAGHRLQALDGVTMALDLEAGLLPVDVGYRRAAEQGRPLHYGFSASWAAARGQVMTGADTDANIFRILTMLGDPQWQRPSRPQELEAVLALLANELAAGALGIGVLVGYAPSSDPAEFLAVAQLAAAAGVPTYTHVREWQRPTRTHRSTGPRRLCEPPRKPVPACITATSIPHRGDISTGY